MVARLAYLNHDFKPLWLVLAVVISLFGFQASAQNGLTATVDWDPSTSTNVVSYNVYYGTSSGNYTNSISVDASSTSTVISGLDAGTTYFFAVTAVDANFDESDFSPEAYVSLPGAPQLITQTGIDGDGNMFMEITTQQTITRAWQIQFSEDLVNWYGFDNGYGGTVDVTWFDLGAFEQMYFRLALF